MSSEGKRAVVVDGIEYAFPEKLTYRELGIIKRVAHVTGPDGILEALRAEDTDIVVAMAVVAMRRAGARVTEDDLLDKDAGSISFLFEAPAAVREAEVGPPAPAVVAPAAPAEPTADQSIPEMSGHRLSSVSTG